MSRTAEKLLLWRWLDLLVDLCTDSYWNQASQQKAELLGTPHPRATSNPRTKRGNPTHFVLWFAAGAAGVLTTSKLNTLQRPHMRAVRLGVMWNYGFRTNTKKEHSFQSLLWNAHKELRKKAQYQWWVFCSHICGDSRLHTTVKTFVPHL